MISTRTIGTYFWQHSIEFLASILTMVAVLSGTTTLIGAIFNALSVTVWWWIVIEKKMWGLIPAEFGFSVIAIYNLTACLR